MLLKIRQFSIIQMKIVSRFQAFETLASADATFPLYCPGDPLILGDPLGVPGFEEVSAFKFFIFKTTFLNPISFIKV